MCSPELRADEHGGISVVPSAPHLGYLLAHTWVK